MFWVGAAINSLLKHMGSGEIKGRIQENGESCDFRLQSILFSSILDAMSIEIQSPQNKNYRRWMSLHDSVGVKKYSQCLVSGYKNYT